MIIVGIDVASEKHDYFMLRKETGEFFSSSALTILNNEAGYKKLHKDIQTFCGATGDSKVRIGLESTGIYHTNIIAFLLEQNYETMMINPILTNMARKASKVHTPKNDNLDAQTICKYLVDNESSFAPYTLTLYHIQSLKSLSRKRFYIVEDLRKAKLAVNNLIQTSFSLFSLNSKHCSAIFTVNLLCPFSRLTVLLRNSPKPIPPRWHLCSMADANALQIS